MAKAHVGDFVRYINKDELGLVGQVYGDNLRCWWHTGGTINAIHEDLVEVLSPNEAVAHKFTNEYAKASLFERALRLYEIDADTTDLIDRNDIREEVYNMLNILELKL